MVERYKEQLHTLRRKFPIGIQQAVYLLNQYKGDIAMVEQQYKDDILKKITEQSGLEETIVHGHLQTHNYDISKTLTAIEQEQYTLTERILKSSKNIKQVLFRMLTAVYEEANIKPIEDQLSLSTLHKFPTKHQPLLLIMDWFVYAEWEGLAYAVSHLHMDLVLKELEDTLVLKDIVSTIAGARKRKIELKDKQFPDTSNIQIHCDFYNSLNRDNVFSGFKAEFLSHKEQILDRLFHYIQANKGAFPK